MPEIPFKLQWSIPENRLISLKDSIYQECLYSTSISIDPDFGYFLMIYPNGGRKDQYQGQTRIYLYLNLNDVKKVEAKWNLSIESANFSVSSDYIFEENSADGISICDTKDFFDPEKKFIVDGKCTVKITGTFKFENETSAISEIGQQQKWNGGELGDKLWAKDGTKDFTIVADGKDIRVHKAVLDAQSNVFSAMLNNPKMKESIESKVLIPDFSFDVVETAVKLIYNCNFVPSLSLDDQMFLLQFSDKYDLPTLKEKVELHLINQISSSNVCLLTNCSAFANSENLKKKCMDFMVASVTKQIPFSDIELLHKEIALKILKNSFVQIVEIDDS